MRLGELTVAAYHSLPAVMPHQGEYDERLRDVAHRAGTSCVLVAGDGMPAAKHLYESLGFERKPSIDFSPVPGIDLIGYALDLAGSADEPGDGPGLVDPQRS